MGLFLAGMCCSISLFIFILLLFTPTFRSKRTAGLIFKHVLLSILWPISLILFNNDHRH